MDLQLLESGAAQKDRNQTRWKTIELLVLISAKRHESEKYAAAKTRDKMRSADVRWREVEEFCRREGVIRKAGQCRKRWEKMSADFKRVHDYQKQIPNGLLGYFEMGNEERKRRKLPLNFAFEWYEAMQIWVPNHGVINHEPEHITESKPAENDPPQASMHPSHNDSPFTGDLEEEEEDVTNAEDDSHMGGGRGGLGGEEDGSSPGDELPSQEGPGSNTPTAADGRGWKRSRNEKGDDQFVKLTKKFLETVAAETAKRNLHDAEFLELERQKHADHLALAAKNHASTQALAEKYRSDQLAYADRLASEVSGAMKEVAASLRFFATELAKKL